jgi:DNA-binding transcriptional MerR regulator
MNENPSFNLSVVLRETGIKADTLRAWERRYGLPSPARTQGKHRLYSERDIETIKWLLARLGEGLRIRNAVDLWHEIEASGLDPVTTRQTSPSIIQPVQLPAIRADLDEIRNAWVSYALDFDETSAEIVLAQSFARYPIEAVSLQVLQKGIHQIGEMWFTGEITVQQEHFVSALAIRHLDALLASAPPPTRNKRVLIGCPPQEEHIFSNLLIALLLRQRGWDVVYLGANVPVSHLDTTIKATQPDLVILTAMRLNTAATLLQTSLAINGKTKFAYGGLIFNSEPELRNRIPGYFLGENYEIAIQSIEQILMANLRQPKAIQISEDYKVCLDYFLENRTIIDLTVWQKIQSIGLQNQHFETAKTHFPESIIASLKLGHINGLDSEIEWIKQLLVNNNIPAEMLDNFLNLYLEALKTNLDERGQILIAWLSQKVERKL